MEAVDEEIEKELRRREKAMRKAARKVYKKRRFEEQLLDVLQRKMKQVETKQKIHEKIEKSLPEVYRRRAEK